MCILFAYNGACDDNSDYSLVLISNRDEFYDRRTQQMEQWSEDTIIVGGKDLEVADGGTWLGITPTYKKLGGLLNLPGVKKDNAKSRGKIVADYVRNNEPIEKYVEGIKNYTKECNEFIFVSIEFGKSSPIIHSYSNGNDQLKLHDEAVVGFGNNLPDEPLTKVEAGRVQMEEVCRKFNKETMEKELIENLIALLKSDERHLPDHQLETRNPKAYKELSSIYVCIPLGRYGTRTHTIVLLTKKGRLYVCEYTQQMPIDPASPKWDKTEFTFDLNATSQL
ncbi:transport and golgi organization 2 [Anticarsia gemmatalis]|uniref:transport and golgi organization 2 n=1 Tax=Anticarsia gemmatalis TaxID=129554 RepID=UPI003F772E7A